uniref:GDP-fucose protein O-fucosyltransferase 2,Spondin-1 n=1 Tax=Caenorhabditis elegans TaxID=6239 RepID=UPI0021F91F3F|nr:Chain A, GDP-fucose protein O-fucosyltransferase 2,Spondin-1 [Caenorhabditis elegans]8AY1_B Chain B, GDP-fucose protein O-fucosyltransferase 2,Spondin-1 [Caenorhabditis elegans]
AEKKFLLYDVNFGEGFNLRRDVYMRVANTVRSLRDSGENYILVLPPWGRLHHWKRMEVALSWRLFFDLESLNRFIPVIEFEDFLDENRPIDQVIYLQHYAEGWGTEYVRKFEKRSCLPPAESHYKQVEEFKWKGWFYSYEDVYSRNFQCVSIQGDSGTLKDLLKHSNFSESTSIMVDRAETILHEHYGEVDYWKARRSMRYSNDLVDVADAFRKKYLDSDDKRDKTKLVDDWTKEKPRRTAIGGPYLGIHWRRRDFLYAKKAQLPTIPGTAKILQDLCKKLDLQKIYLATDAPDQEVDELKALLNGELEVYRFTDTQKLNDGQIAIIDQYLCAHAAYFIGSYESTFTFRIQEDREIIGFPISTTFNRLCPDTEPTCEQPCKWKIVYSSGGGGSGGGGSGGGGGSSGSSIPCLLSPWSCWSDCSVTCGKGMRTRQRMLKSLAELGDCNEDLEQAEKCMLPECP